MREHYALSKTEEDYLNNQIALQNSAQTHKRIASKVEKALNSFPTICSSKVISQGFKDRLFPHNKINQFLHRLIQYDPQSSIDDEANKQAIALEMVTTGLEYFQNRYETNDLIREQINKTHDVLNILNRQSEEEREKHELMKMYKIRKRFSSPPIIQRNNFYNGICMYCFVYTRDHSNQNEVVKNLKHDRYCTYTKKIKHYSDKNEIKRINEQYLKIFPPLKNKISS